MAHLADQLKERGNVAFRDGQYVQAELLYTQAIEKYNRNHLIFNNRANVRIKLQRWDDTVNDCLRSIELSRLNHKAYYFLAQAQLALHHPSEALASALTAYSQIRSPSPSIKTSTKDLETFSTFVLKCKKAKFSYRERERLRLRGDLQAEIEELLEKGRQDELTKVTRRVEALELRPAKASELSEDIQSHYERKIAELRTTFVLSDSSTQQQREIPDHLIDMITFEPMHDPVMTISGHSYERATILEHLKRSPTDPLTRQALKLEDLRPNLALKAACDLFWEGDTSKWVVDW